jgi:hypothetical protein
MVYQPFITELNVMVKNNHSIVDLKNGIQFIIKKKKEKMYYTKPFDLIY